jgi:uncharacterized membrane protein YphA (DoxX/SURF4 family)
MLVIWINYFLAWLFVVSGSLKLRNLAEFRGQLKSFNFMHPDLARLTAFLVPCVELCLGLLMIVLPARFIQLALAAVILLVFTIFIAWALKKRKNTSCFCFGEADGEISRVTLIRNAVLLSMSTAACSGSLIGVGKSPVAITTTVLLLGYGAIGVLLFLAGFQLADLYRKEFSPT